jgi:xanthine dehydrogenase accessory factor
MPDLADILAAYAVLRQQNEAFAVATVARIDGPAYRRPGARMLVDVNGRTTGAISAGCLEDEVTQHAIEVIEQGTPRVLRFDVTEADPVLGFGSGCGGTVYILVERVTPSRTDDPLLLIQTARERRANAVLATVISGTGAFASGLARHRLYQEGLDPVGQPILPSFEVHISADALDTLAGGTTTIRRIEHEGDAVEILYERIEPPIRLLLLGNGHDVGAVVRFGAILGWEVAVVGNRPVEELSALFPEATHYYFVMHPEDLPQRIKLDRRTAVVIMNHNYHRDREFLSLLFNASTPYLGVLGPRSRTDRMLKDLNKNELECDFLRAPVGLDLGAETPEEIALSIVSEVLAVFNGRGGESLSHRLEPIHDAIRML